MEMNFCVGKRSVACALSMAVLFSVTLGVPAIVATCINPLIKDFCRVDVGSYGYDDSEKCGYLRTSGNSSEEILDPTDTQKSRGILLFELDATTCTTRNRQHFDTYGIPDDRIQLVEALDAASAGTILIGVSADTAETENNAFRNYVNWAFTKYNMNLIGVGLEYRDKFAFIMQKGYPKKTKYFRKARNGDCLETSFTLSGSTVSDVRFK